MGLYSADFDTKTDLLLALLGVVILWIYGALLFRRRKAKYKTDTAYSYSSVLVCPLENYSEELSHHDQLYEADGSVLELAYYLSAGGEVVEDGGGSGRFARKLMECFPKVRLTVTDNDQHSLDYARKHLKGVTCVLANAEEYKHPWPVKLRLSQGLLHHMSKEQVQKYLRNVMSEIRSAGGLCILSDEVIPPHDESCEEARQEASLITHLRVIAYAQNRGRTILPLEEALTVLDDMFGEHCYKSEEQTRLILENARRINGYIYRNEAQRAVKELLHQLIAMRPQAPSGRREYDESRGDRKRSLRELTREVLDAGCDVVEIRTHGLVHEKGGFVVLVLK